MRSSRPKASQPEPIQAPTPVPAPAPAPPSTPVLAPLPVPAVPALAEKSYKPKLCRLEKTAAGFGFHLNGIQGVNGQYIKEVGMT